MVSGSKTLVTPDSSSRVYTVQLNNRMIYAVSLFPIL